MPSTLSSLKALLHPHIDAIHAILDQKPHTGTLDQWIATTVEAMVPPEDQTAFKKLLVEEISVYIVDHSIVGYYDPDGTVEVPRLSEGVSDALEDYFPVYFTRKSLERYHSAVRTYMIRCEAGRMMRSNRTREYRSRTETVVYIKPRELAAPIPPPPRSIPTIPKIMLPKQNLKSPV